MTDHSPAPFLAEYSPYQGPSGEIPAFRIYDANGDVVAETCTDKPLAAQKADADLFAAAPELLEALRFCDMTLADLEASERKGYIDHAKQMSRVALSKLNGGAV